VFELPPALGSHTDTGFLPAEPLPFLPVQPILYLPILPLSYLPILPLSYLPGLPLGLSHLGTRLAAFIPTYPGYEKSSKIYVIES
jgi:hypothetical protein